MPVFSRGRTRVDGGLLAFFALLGVLTFAGGSSRVDEVGQMFAQLGAVAAGAGALVARDRQGGRALWAPFWLLTAFAVTMAIQLVPLPPGLWAALPGRDTFAAIARLVADDARWRPISVTPDATISALLGLLPAFAAVIALSTVPRDRLWWVFYGIGACMAVSALLGLVQVVGGSDGGLYLYRNTNVGVATGIFSNRNHAALFSALGLPLVAAVLRHVHRGGRDAPQPAMLTLGAVAMLLLLIANVATGSRAGLLAALVGLVAAVLLVAPMIAIWMRHRSPSRRTIVLLAVAAVIAAAGLAWLLLGSRWESIARFRSLNVSSDGRVVLLAPNLALARAYFPIGAGFGSFPQIFRVVEPFENLDLTYLNHAHNDWLEIVIEAGIAGVLIGAATAVWLIRQVGALRRIGSDDDRAYGWVGTAWIGMISLASMFDYPLRTPLFSVIWIVAMAAIAIACTPSRSAQ